MISKHSRRLLGLCYMKLLRLWVARHIQESSLIWLDDKIEKIANTGNEKIFFTAFSSVPRFTGKNDLKLTPDDLQTAAAFRPGWNPSNWSVDQGARTLLVLALVQQKPEKYVQIIERAFTTADVNELVALYQSLPLFAYPEKWLKRACEGVRCNMTVVFNAVALQNPYPAEYFDNLAWNQMVLKALFVGSPLNSIYGLGERANPALSKMLTDYIQERRSAKRSVSDEVWQLLSIK